MVDYEFFETFIKATANFEHCLKFVSNISPQFNIFAEWKHECDNESEAVMVVYRMK